MREQSEKDWKRYGTALCRYGRTYERVSASDQQCERCDSEREVYERRIDSAAPLAA